MALAAFTAVELIHEVLTCPSIPMFACILDCSSFILTEKELRWAEASDRRIWENA
jgi:hypothetical protein